MSGIHKSGHKYDDAMLPLSYLMLSKYHGEFQLKIRRVSHKVVLNLTGN